MPELVRHFVQLVVLWGMRLRAVSRGVLIFVVGSSLHAADPGSKADFLSTPAISPEGIPKLKKPAKGTLQVTYRDGKITGVKVLETAGSKELDAIAVRHVQQTYRLRPGASGTVKLPFLLNRTSPPIVSRGQGSDFISTPILPIPAQLRHTLTRSGDAYAIIDYSNGKISRVRMMKTTGNAALDKLINYHIFLNFKVKPGANGSARLPVGVRF